MRLFARSLYSLVSILDNLPKKLLNLYTTFRLVNCKLRVSKRGGIISEIGTLHPWFISPKFSDFSLMSNNDNNQRLQIVLEHFLHFQKIVCHISWRKNARQPQIGTDDKSIWPSRSFLLAVLKRSTIVLQTITRIAVS